MSTQGDISETSTLIKLQETSPIVEVTLGGFPLILITFLKRPFPAEVTSREVFIKTDKFEVAGKYSLHSDTPHPGSSLPA